MNLIRLDNEGILLVDLKELETEMGIYAPTIVSVVNKKRIPFFKARQH